VPTAAPSFPPVPGPRPVWVLGAVLVLVAAAGRSLRRTVRGARLVSRLQPDPADAGRRRFQT
jgi:hypothetical protein